VEDKTRKAVNLIHTVEELALSMGLNVFVVCDGAMGVINTDNKCKEVFDVT
jgi:hypothetical protein